MKKLEQLWEGIKLGDIRSLFFAAMICTIPVFLYSILGSIFFGITLSGDDIGIHLASAPLYLILGYLFLRFLYLIFWVWTFKKIFKKDTGE